MMFADSLLPSEIPNAKWKVKHYTSAVFEKYEEIMNLLTNVSEVSDVDEQIKKLKGDIATLRSAIEELIPLIEAHGD